MSVPAEKSTRAAGGRWRLAPRLDDVGREVWTSPAEIEPGLALTVVVVAMELAPGRPSSGSCPVIPWSTGSPGYVAYDDVVAGNEPPL